MPISSETSTSIEREAILGRLAKLKTEIEAETLKPERDIERIQRLNREFSDLQRKLH